MQGDEGPSYLEERSYFVTLDNFSPRTNDDDDDNSGDDDDDNNCEDRTSEDTYSDQLNNDQLLTALEDTDDIVPAMVCRLELGADNRSSGYEEDISPSEPSSSGYSVGEISNDTVDMPISPDRRLKAHLKSKLKLALKTVLKSNLKSNLKSRNGDYKTVIARLQAASPLVNSDSSSSSESSPFYHDRPCPKHYGKKLK